jgi:allantoin racemase
MKIQVVFPGPEPGDIKETLDIYNGFAHPGTIISCIPLDASVPKNADPTDPYVLPAILKRIQESEREGMDAVIINCMEDPGMEAGRQLVSIPVIGPAQASFHLACILGYKFSVIFPLDNKYYVEKLVDRYGLTNRLASIQLMDISLEEFGTNKKSAIASLIKSSIRAIEDGAHVIVPGCMFSIGVAHQVQMQLKEKGYIIPVINPGLAAVRMAETFVDMQVSVSRRTYPPPLGITDPYW